MAPRPQHPLTHPCSQRRVPGGGRCPLPVQPGDGAHARHRVPDSGKGSVAGSDSFPCPPPPRDRRAQQSHQGGCGRDPPGCFPACKTGSRQSERRPLPPFVSAPGSRGPLVCPVPGLGVWPGLPTAGRGAGRPRVAALCPESPGRGEGHAAQPGRCLRASPGREAVPTPPRLLGGPVGKGGRSLSEKSHDGIYVPGSQAPAAARRDTRAHFVR